MKGLKLSFLLLLIIFVSCKNQIRKPSIIEIDTEKKNEHIKQLEIINGIPVYDISEIPWQVGLLEPKEEIDCFCGGSIINQKWILTAAHCLYYENSEGIKQRRTISDIYIFANSSNLNQGGEIYEIIKIIEHPNYNKQTNDNDIALLELHTPINIYYENQIVELPTQEEFESLYQTGINVYVSGWGATSVNGDEYPEVLMKTKISFKDHSICKQNYSSVNSLVTNNMICVSGTFTDSCSGDSGGPLFTVIDGKEIQLGITSWGGFPCADPKLFGVYTNTFNYKDWINENCLNCLDNNVSI